MDKDKILKDNVSKAILSVDNSGLIAYKKRRDKIRLEKQQIGKIPQIEESLNEIKAMLQQLLGKQ